MTKKIYTLPFALLCIFTVLLVLSCRKEKITTAPVTQSEFMMSDSLKIDTFFARTYPEIYNMYDGKLYSVRSVNKVSFDIRKTNNEIVFTFKDTSVAGLASSFTVTLKKTEFEFLLPNYALSDTSVIKMTDAQELTDGSYALGLEDKVLSGILKISYNKKFNTVSGEINNLKIPLSYYVPENISTSLRLVYGPFILNSGSTRTVNLKFSDVRVE